jgi:hypothetical protein
MQEGQALEGHDARAPRLVSHASWRASIREARRQIELILDDSPSLRRQMPSFVA